MKTLLALILLVALAAGAYFYLNNSTKRDELHRAQEEAVRRTEQMKNAARDKLREVAQNAPEIKQEIERGSEAVRKKAEEVGTVIKDATADARITATVKAKLVKDPNLSALQISVNTTDGVVTLAGRVSSDDEAKRAVNLALDTEGVREAISTLQVKPSKP
jgi:hyperosmotically inducible periplasmic protein